MAKINPKQTSSKVSKNRLCSYKQFDQHGFTTCMHLNQRPKKSYPTTIFVLCFIVPSDNLISSSDFQPMFILFPLH